MNIVLQLVIFLIAVSMAFSIYYTDAENRAEVKLFCESQGLKFGSYSLFGASCYELKDSVQINYEVEYNYDVKSWVIIEGAKK